ncbi:MAG: sulfite exporter TauE/SafE family protein [Roseivirga sp.]|nr:sulfite exporter TauE/SafE family protein [Roseivirga sp.]
MDTNDLLLFFLTFISAFVGINFGGTMLLIVPLLLSFGYSPLLVLSSTRPAVMAQSLLGIRMFRKHRDLIRSQEVTLLVSAALGGLVGTTILSRLSNEQGILLMISILILLVLVSGVKTILIKSNRLERVRVKEKKSLLVYFLVGLSPAIIGGLVGAGGGPVVVLLALLALKKSTYATAYLEKFVSLGHSSTVMIWAVFYGAIDVRLSLIMLSATMIGAYLGAKVTLKLSPYWMYSVIVLLCLALVLKQFFV